jgi:glycosyltransferase involved in cell wall biosynthesis
MTLRIAFDSQAFRMQQRGGISRYVVMLAQGLQRLQQEVRIVAPIHHNEHLAEAQDIPKSEILGGRWAMHRRLEDVVTRLAEPIALQRFRPDVLHATYYAGTARPRNGLRVLTVHDMVHERFVQWHPGHPILELKKQAVAAADHVICISRRTQQDLCELLDCPIEKTSVVYHGGSQLNLPTAVTEQPVVAMPFVLYVGARYTHKNFEVLLRAFAQNRTLRESMALVAFGGGRFNPDELRMATAAGLPPDRLIQTSGDDALLAGYFRKAAAFVYPSLYEGFGMPLLEAMSLDCPVVSSNSSCLPEIAGDAALYFDPGDADQLAAQIIRITNEPRLRTQLRINGRERLKQFSWEKCAFETLAVYRSIINA